MAISTIYSYGSSNRITGMFSGMDTDTLVQNMLKTEQSKIDSSYKSRTKLEWKRDAYQSINSTLKTFQEKYLSALSSDNMWSTGAYSAYTTNLESNRYLDVKATSAAFDTQYTISSAKKAGYAEISGDKYVSRGQAIGYAGQNSVSYIEGNSYTGSETLAELAGDNLQEGDKVSFAINGKTFVFEGDSTLNDVISEVNAAGGETNVKMELVGEGASKTLKMSTTKPGQGIELEDISGGMFAEKDGVLGISVSSMQKVTTVDMAAALSDMSNVDAIFGELNSIKISINGKEFTFSKSDSMQDVMDAINSSDAGVTMSYNAAEDRFTIKNDDPNKKLELKDIQGDFFNADGPIGINENTAGLKTYDTIARAAEKMGLTDVLDDNGKFSFTVNGKTFSFDADTKISEMMQKVNGDGDVNVKMSYSEITDSFTFRSAATGAASEVRLGNSEGSSAFGENSFFAIDDGAAARGTDASITFETSSGAETITQTGNEFTLDGVTYTIKEDFDAAADGGNISFGVTQDTGAVIDKVKEFVTEYNKIVETLNGYIHEEKEYDYDILSEAEREDLTEEELELWDSKAKSGILRNDNYISNLLSNMRTALYEKVGDTGLSAADIGLTTGAWDKQGQIQLDEAKLKSALEKNPGVVGEVLAGTSSSQDTATARTENGLMTRFYNDITKYQSNMRTTVLAGVNKDINNFNTKIDDQLAKMYEKQEKYYLQFAQMESIMSKYSSQRSYFTQLLGG